MADIYIAVIGTATSGIYEFKQYCARGNLVTSCGPGLQDLTLKHGDSTVHIINSLGSDKITDLEAKIYLPLRLFLAALSKQSNKRILFSGIMFFQSVQSSSFDTIPINHFPMFEKLCGAGFPPRISLVMTAPKYLSSDGHELKVRDRISDGWAYMLDRGSLYLTYNSTPNSAFEVLDLFLRGLSLNETGEAYNNHVEHEKSNCQNEIDTMKGLQEQLVEQIVQQKTRLDHKDEEIRTIHEINAQNETVHRQELKNLQVTLQQLQESLQGRSREIRALQDRLERVENEVSGEFTY